MNSMDKKGKIALLWIFITILIWVLMLVNDIPGREYSFFREISVITILTAIFSYLIYLLTKRTIDINTRAETFTKMIIDENHFPICSTKNGIILYANRRFLKLLGYRNLIFLKGRDVAELFQEETARKIREYLNSTQYDSSINFKFLYGYLKNRGGKLLHVNIFIQKFTINGIQFEYFNLIEKEIIDLTARDVPIHISQILNNLRDIIVYLDTDRRIQWINEPGIKFLGRHADQILGQPCHRVFFGSEAPCDRCPIQKSICDGSPEEKELKLANGRYFLIKAEPIKDEKGKKLGAIKVMSDITVQKEAEAKRYETEVRLSLISEQIPTLVWTVDDNLKVTYATGSVLQDIKIPRDTIKGKTIYELFNTSDPEHPVIKHILLGLTGEAGSYQVRIMGRNYIVFYRPLRNADGKITGVVGVSQDITELVTIQRELEEKNRVLQIIGDINQIISHTESEEEMIQEILDLLSRKKYFANTLYIAKSSEVDELKVDKASFYSDSLSAIFGVKLSDKEIYRHPAGLCYLDSEIKIVNKYSADDYSPYFIRQMEELGYHSAVFLPIIIDNRVTSIICLLSERGDDFRTTDYFRDIIEDIRFAITNFRLKQRQKKNEEIIKEIQLKQFIAGKYEYASRLASSLAHDFNNILLSINSYVDLIRQDIKTDNQIEEYLHNINALIKKGGELTSYLMKYSNYKTINLRPTDIQSIYGSLQNEISRLCNLKSIRFTARFTPIEKKTHCDPNSLQESFNMVTRFIINRSQNDSIIYLIADPAYPRDEPSQAGEPQFVKFQILSSLTMFDEDFTDNIFELSVLNISDDQPEFSMPLVNNIIRLHGGYIYAEKNEYGKGFVIILPLESDLRELNTYSNKNKDSERRSILIVEDAAEVKEPLKLILKELKCNILTACDGLSALQLARTINYEIDILITDVEIPQMDGITLAEEIYNKNPKIRTIYISGYLKDLASLEGRFVPNSIFLQKPFSLSIFRNIVSDTLNSTTKR